MIWLLGLPIPPALVAVFAGVTLPAALIAAAIGVRFIRLARRPGAGWRGRARGVLGLLLVAYGVADLATVVYLLGFYPGELVPRPG